MSAPSPTRRALIGGAGLAAVAAAMPTIAAAQIRPRNDVAWTVAKASVDSARAYDVAINATHSRATTRGTLTDALETEWDRSGTALGEAEWALFKTSAPDLAAIEWKIAMLVEHQLVDDDIARTLLADLRHLRGGN